MFAFFMGMKKYIATKEQHLQMIINTHAESPGLHERSIARKYGVQQAKKLQRTKLLNNRQIILNNNNNINSKLTKYP